MLDIHMQRYTRQAHKREGWKGKDTSKLDRAQPSHSPRRPQWSLLWKETRKETLCPQPVILISISFFLQECPRQSHLRSNLLFVADFSVHYIKSSLYKKKSGTQIRFKEVLIFWCTSAGTGIFRTQVWFLAFIGPKSEDWFILNPIPIFVILMFDLIRNWVKRTQIRILMGTC